MPVSEIPSSFSIVPTSHLFRCEHLDGLQHAAYPGVLRVCFSQQFQWLDKGDTLDEGDTINERAISIPVSVGPLPSGRFPVRNALRTEN